MPGNTRNDFFITARFRQTFRKNFDLPALTFGIAQIHPQQHARKQRAFLTAGASADFEENVARVVWVFGQEQRLQLGSSCAIRSRALRASSAAKSRNAGSSSMPRAVCSSACACCHCAQSSTSGASSACSRIRARYRSSFDVISSWLSVWFSSSSRCASCSSLRCIFCFIRRISRTTAQDARVLHPAPGLKRGLAHAVKYGSACMKRLQERPWGLLRTPVFVARERARQIADDAPPHAVYKSPARRGAHPASA